MLGTPRARSNAPAFALGWLVGLAIAGGVTLVIASGRAQEDGSGPATWVSVLKLILGLLFLLLAARTWHGRPRAGEEAPMPKWMRVIDRFTATRSLVFGVVLSAANPKNLALTVAAAAAIGQAGISTGEVIGALAVFILIGSLTILAPVFLYFALGARAAALLDDAKAWMAAHNAAIMTVLFLVLGVTLIGDAIAGLS